MEVPLFPLQTVLFPDGPLPLRIFEQRYLDMISRCMKNEAPFGVLLIKDGTETGPAKTYDIGTLATITDWYQGSDGLLGVTATGGQRFRKVSEQRQADGLLVGEIELLRTDRNSGTAVDVRALAKVLESILENLGKLYDDLEKRYDDAGWVTYRFAEILPVSAEEKQAWLELDDVEERARRIRSALETVRI